MIKLFLTGLLATLFFLSTLAQRPPTGHDFYTNIKSFDGVFIPDQKYVPYGWDSYVKSYSSDESEAGKARAIENSKWWDQ